MSDAAKINAARGALEFVKPGMVLGLGTGSTAAHFVRLLAEQGAKNVCVATSVATHDLAAQLGLNIVSPDEVSSIDVTVDGKPFQEMHVDGGAFAQAFLYPASLTAGRRERMRRHESVITANAYVIRNAHLDPEWAKVDRRTMSIAGRAISTMITASGYNDVLRIYNTTQRDEVGYNLAYIGTDFTKELPAPFDQDFMRALFEYGYQRGKAGYDWARKPPF